MTNPVGNYGTVSFLGENIQRDWRAQVAANVTAVKGRHTLKGGVEFNHVDAFQKFGFNQFGAWNLSGTATNALEVLSAGGPTPNRFDTTAATYSKQLGNLELALASDELALFVQDTWKVTPAFTLNAGLRWEGAFNPTPEANNDFMLNSLSNFTFPVGKTADPTQIPDQLSQFGPRVGFAWDPNMSGRNVIRGYTGVYYARTPMLLYAAPMNNFRIPPGDLSASLPLSAPGNPDDTVYKQMALIGIDLNRFALNSLPILTTEQITQIASALGLVVNPYLNAAPFVVDQDYKNPRAWQGGLGTSESCVMVSRWLLT